MHPRTVVQIIVIARLPGIYMYGDVNHPCPQATLLDSDQFIAINPWPHAITTTQLIINVLDGILATLVDLQQLQM